MPTPTYSSSSREPLLYLCVALLVVAVLGGGGQGALGDVAAQLLAVFVLGFLGWRAARGTLAWHASRWIRWLPMLALALPLIQLLPIPEALWVAAPARAELHAQLTQAGVSPVPVISLNHAATEQALWWLLTPVALFLASLCLSRSGLRWLFAMIVAMAVVSVLLGLVQVAQGPTSPLRFYSNTNPTEAVGFFANRNHLATLLVMSLPLAIAGTARAVDGRGDGRGASPLRLVGGVCIVVLLILGIATTRSRAGLLLGMLAVLASFPIVMGVRNRRGTQRLLALAIGVAIMLSVQFALVGMLQQMNKDPLDDKRWIYAQVTREAAAAYAPLGSGLGTFRQAYQPFEVAHEPDNVIVNHAHNDYLELWLEGGVVALVLIAAGLGAWIWRGVLLVRPAGEPGTAEANAKFWARIAWLSASLALLHSALDYPLRTSADLAVFAILAAAAFRGTQRN